MYFVYFCLFYFVLFYFISLISLLNLFSLFNLFNLFNLSYSSYFLFIYFICSIYFYYSIDFIYCIYRHNQLLRLVIESLVIMFHTCRNILCSLYFIMTIYILAKSFWNGHFDLCCIFGMLCYLRKWTECFLPCCVKWQNCQLITE